MGRPDEFVSDFAAFNRDLMGLGANQEWIAGISNNVPKLLLIRLSTATKYLLPLADEPATLGDWYDFGGFGAAWTFQDQNGAEHGDSIQYLILDT